MLIIGDHECVGYLSPHIKIYNVSSLLEGYVKLNILPYSVRYSDEKEFDLEYALYILENDNVFFDMMKIIYNLYIGNDVYLLVTIDQFSEIVTESLLKFIQQRYGYIGNRVNEPEDFETLVDGEFTLFGVFNLDHDKERFSYLITKSILSGGGSIDNFDIKSIL